MIRITRKIVGMPLRLPRTVVTLPTSRFLLTVRRPSIVTPRASTLLPKPFPLVVPFSAAATRAAMTTGEEFYHSSGITDAVWVHEDPYSNSLDFQPLNSDIETDICIVGAGITGISIAYELVKRQKEVVLVEARDILAGETGRTTGHLASALDDLYHNIANKHGKSGAKFAAESHQWALDRVGEIASELSIDCEYRHLPGYMVPEHERGSKEYDDDIQEIKQNVEAARQSGLQAEFDAELTVKGWDGKPDQRGGAIFQNQATFHPTKYCKGVLAWLKKQSNFRCYTRTRIMSLEEKGLKVLSLGHKYCQVHTESGNTIQCEHAIEATNVPLQKLSVIIQEAWYRTYAIAMRIPKGSVEDCLLYDSADPYKYVRITHCDDQDDYLVVGGSDHKVGQEEARGRFDELEKWTRERFTQGKTVDYRWSGQVFEPVDYMAFIGKNQGNERIYIVTGDSGNGLTHGVLASKLIADLIEGKPNDWERLYSPKRVASMAKSAPEMLAHDVKANLQYKRFLQSDIQDIEDLGPGCGGVLNATASKPVAIYKDENGEVTKMSAICPHLHAVVCWNPVEKSWDCPVHGSRFGPKGLCVQGPAKANLSQA
ncbi:FAD dependent oxidoreductase [Xylaria venustula]|nr:FAD dependent oxidoreductase [Xylaria venustula]